MIEAFRGLDANILVQEFIKEAGGERRPLLRRRRPRRGDDEAAGGGGRVPLEPASRRHGGEGEDHARGAVDRRAGRAHDGAQHRRRRRAALQPRPGGDGGQLVAGARRASRRRPASTWRARSSSSSKRTPRRESSATVAKAENPADRSRRRLRQSRRTPPAGNSRRRSCPPARGCRCRSSSSTASKPGPTAWISAAVHGDEVNGVEIIGGVLERITPRDLAGCLITVPIVNVFGFNAQSRYLPDRRDLNRSFPGSERGSLAARIAFLFMQEVVRKCQYGIDLHTGSNHRTNLPQIRANLHDDETRRTGRGVRGAGDHARRGDRRLAAQGGDRRRRPHDRVRSGRAAAVRRRGDPTGPRRRAARAGRAGDAEVGAQEEGAALGARGQDHLGPSPQQRHPAARHAAGRHGRRAAAAGPRGRRLRRRRGAAAGARRRAGHRPHEQPARAAGRGGAPPGDDGARRQRARRCRRSRSTRGDAGGCGPLLVARNYGGLGLREDDAAPRGARRPGDSAHSRKEPGLCGLRPRFRNDALDALSSSAPNAA